MSVGERERDRFTGHMTTGHEWNGITELNTPVPKVLLVFLAIAFLFALGYWYLMPSFPLGEDYARGRLGIDQRRVLAAELADARAAQAPWRERIEAADFDEIRGDPTLMRVVGESGARLFRDNCAGCHGRDGQGGNAFPNLADDAWLWGADDAGILRTLEVGINADHPETRVAQMPALGRLGTLDGQQIRDVVAYVRSLSDPSVGNGKRAEELLSVNAGARTYASVCAGCHGADGGGNPALGAPNLGDEVWLYGGDEQSLVQTIRDGRGGYMPAWDSRLSLAQRKILTLYVLSLGEGGTDGAEPVAGVIR